MTTWTHDPSHYPEPMTPLSADVWFGAMGHGIRAAARELRAPFGGFETMTAATPHVANGRVIAIAQTRTRRAKGHPNVPTMQEQGFEGFEATTWYGLVGPRGLPLAITQKVNADVNTVLAMPDVQEKLDTYGAEDGGGSADKFATFIRTEIAKWAKVVKDAGIEPQ